MSDINRGSSRSERSINRSRKERKRRNILILVFSGVLLLIGYYILNYISSLEKPPISATFNILLGCTIIAVSVIVFGITFKKQYFPKKRKKSNHVFLEDHLKNESETTK